MRSNQLSYPAIVFVSECKGTPFFINGKSFGVFFTLFPKLISLSGYFTAQTKHYRSS